MCRISSAFGGTPAACHGIHPGLQCDDCGKRHWYSSLPSFLIGASLEGVTDPDHANPVNKDITAELHLERGTRIVNAFSVDSAREEWHTHPSAHRPPPLTVMNIR